MDDEAALSASAPSNEQSRRDRRLARRRERLPEPCANLRTRLRRHSSPAGSRGCSARTPTYHRFRRAEMAKSERLRTIPRLTTALAISPIMIGSWALLVSVVPLQMVRAGASAAWAGANTTVFMAATVLAQLLTPRFVSTAGYRPVIATGAILMGLPCLGLLISVNPTWWFTIALVRGVGFGLLTVACISLPARMAPPMLLARLTAAQGVATSITQAAGLGTGLTILDLWGFPLVCVIGFLLPMLGCALLFRVPAIGEPTPASDTHSNAIASLRVRPIMVALAIGIISAVFGAFTILVPISTSADRSVVILTLVTAAMMPGRYVAGRLADTARGGLLALPAMLAAALCVAVLGAARHWCAPVALIYISAAAFGISWGVIQNDAMLALYKLFEHRGRTTASTWWNFAIDFGIGLGSFAFGATVTAAGIDAAYAIAALALVAGAAPAVSMATELRQLVRQ